MREIYDSSTQLLLNTSAQLWSGGLCKAFEATKRQSETRVVESPHHIIVQSMGLLVRLD